MGRGYNKNERAFIFEDAMIAEKKSRKRVAILKAALEIITEFGFHGSSMAAIAEKAGVSAGTLYLYFQGKEDLINELYRSIKIELNEAMLNGASKDFPFRRQFQIRWRNILNFYIDHPLKAIFLDQYSSSPYIRTIIREQVHSVFRHSEDFLVEAIEKEELKDLPLPVIFSLMLGPIIHFARLHHSGRFILEEKMKEEAFEAIWEALRR